MSLSWYVIRSKPHKEEVLYQQLLTRQIESFFPVIRVNPVNPRARKIVPFFPNYIFIRTNLENEGASAFQWIPYSQGLVTFGGEPAFVPDALVHALKRKIDTINAKSEKTTSGFETGDQIRVVDGILRGYEGIVDANLDGKERAKVLINLLGNRQMLVELADSQISHLR